MSPGSSCTVQTIEPEDGITKSDAEYCTGKLVGKLICGQEYDA